MPRNGHYFVVFYYHIVLFIFMTVQVVYSRDAKATDFCESGSATKKKYRFRFHFLKELKPNRTAIL